MRNKITAIIFALVALAGIFIWSQKIQNPSYFALDCAIYDSSFKLIFQVNNSDYCAFANDGSYLSSKVSVERFSFKDREDRLIWSSNEVIHHMLKYSNDQKSFLAISSENIPLGERIVRSDCFSVRDLQNKKLHEWCLGAHLEEIKSLGFAIGQHQIMYPPFPKDQRVKFEISHANSIHEIEDNARGNFDPAFKKGNYLVNIYNPTFAVVILDSEMKNILWSADLSKFPYGGRQVFLQTHDLQVTPEGNILVYANKIRGGLHPDIDEQLKLNLGIRYFWKGRTAPFYSALLEFDPGTKKVVWEHTRDGFFSSILGTVTRLKSGNYLYTELAPSVTEVTVHGELVKNFDSRFGFFYARSVKPMYDDSFLKARE